VFVSPEETGYEFRATLDAIATIGRLTTPLASGVQGRYDVNRLDVTMFSGELASVADPQLLNGANAAAIQTANGGWEVVQFANAEEVEPGQWRLSRLLRSQLGTDDAMLAGAEAGALFVLLDDAVKPAGLRANETGLTLNWRIGPAGAPFTDTHFITLTQRGGLRAALPLSPVHVRSETNPAGDLSVHWTRRGRLDSDNWEGIDIPLGEEQERYRITVSEPGGPVLRTEDLETAQWTYPVASMTADFGAVPPVISFAVQQIGTGGGLGIAAVRNFTIG